MPESISNPPRPAQAGLIDNQPEKLVMKGTLIYLPADVVHSMAGLPDKNVVFFTCKDMSHGIIGMAADATMAGLHCEPGFEPKQTLHLFRYTYCNVRRSCDINKIHASELLTVKYHAPVVSRF